MTIYIATTNAGKLRDFAYAAEQAHTAVMLEPLPGLAGMPVPVEDGDTFEANARLKAEAYSAQAPGMWVLADDSGLEVDALDGRPGVRSARFAEDTGALDAAIGLDASNNAALLLATLEETNRGCRYQCALALARDGAVRAVAFGSLEGELLADPEGSGGFGYDPLFFVPEAGCTMAEVTAEQRLQFSHRGRALRQLLEHLPNDV